MLARHAVCSVGRLLGRVTRPLFNSVAPGWGAEQGGGGAPALLPLNSRLLAIGDSFNDDMSVTTAPSFYNQAYGYGTWAQALCDGRWFVPNGGNLGVSGQTAAQTAAAPNLAAALALSPKAVIMNTGTNSLAGATSAAIIANYATIAAWAESNRVYVVANTILPRQTGSGNDISAPNEVKRQEANIGLLALASTYFRPVNCEALLDWKAGVGLRDGLHTDQTGAYAVGGAVASVLNTLIVQDSILDTVTTLYASNDNFALGSPTATGWSVSAGSMTVTPSKDGGQVLTITGTAGGGSVELNQSFSSILPVPTDNLEAFLDVEIGANSGVLAVTYRPNVLNTDFSSNAVGGTLYPDSPALQLPIQIANQRRVYRTPPIVVQPLGGKVIGQVYNNINIQFANTGSPGSIVLKFRRAAPRKVPVGI